MVEKIIPAIISGGLGTRLWPFSRQYLPKPFVPFFERNLFEQTVNRVSKWGPLYIVTHRTLAPLTEHSIKLVKKEAIFFYEPQACNTLPAIAWLCWELLQKHDAKTIVSIFPSDHFIDQVELFYEDVENLAQVVASGNYIGIIGITPSRPETGYGYIEKGYAISQKENCYQVKAFHEKPNQQLAREYLEKGFLWNAGIFIAQIGVLWNHIQNQAPHIASKFVSLTRGEKIENVYHDMPHISIDRGVIEKLSSDHLIVLPAKFNWSDLGTWESLSQAQGVKNIKPDLLNSHDVTVFGDDQKTYAVIGVNEIIIADTGDALLVTQRKQTDQVSEFVKKFKKEKPHILERHFFEQRPWGDFEVLKEGRGFKTKIINVLPESQLSYQSHQHRSEHWIVVQGKAEVILDDVIHYLGPGDYIFVKAGQKHRLKNPGPELLKVIEVQIGNYLGEDDIKRYEDCWGRA